MLLYSMGASIDGFVADREGDFAWSAPDDELFDVHLARVRGLGATLLGRRLYEAMLVWERDPAMRSTPSTSAFADVWTALPKVVFSSTLDRVEGNARLAEGTVAEEVAAALAGAAGDVEIGGADLAAQAFALDLVDELRLFRYPVVVGGGTPYLPALADPLAFELLEARTFASDVVHERYRRVRG